MDATPSYASDVAFTPTVKAIQTRKGSRRGYATMEQRGSWETRITPDGPRTSRAAQSDWRSAVTPDMLDALIVRPEQVILFTVSAWDSNCPQRFEAADVAAALAERDTRIAALEAEVKSLRGAADRQKTGA